VKVAFDSGILICSSERNFEIRKYQNNRFNTQIEFIKKSYSPGEKAKALMNVKRAEGGVPESAKISFVARIDGKSVSEGKTKL
jgi:alpha-2-macroglobulin-like protein